MVRAGSENDPPAAGPFFPNVVTRTPTGTGPGAVFHDFGGSPTLFTETVGGKKRSLVGACNKNGVYYVFDTSDVGSGPVARLNIANPGDNPKAGNGSIAPSSWDGSHLYVAGGNTTINGSTYGASLRAFDPNNLSAPLWELGYTSGHVLGAVTSAPGLAIISHGLYLTAVKSATGAKAFTGKGNTVDGPASIAYGVVYIGDGKASATELFEAGQTALARAKSDGGNRVDFTAIRGVPALAMVPDSVPVDDPPEGDASASVESTASSAETRGKQILKLVPWSGAVSTQM